MAQRKQEPDPPAQSRRESRTRTQEAPGPAALSHDELSRLARHYAHKHRVTKAWACAMISCMTPDKLAELRADATD